MKTKWMRPVLAGTLLLVAGVLVSRQTLLAAERQREPLKAAARQALSQDAKEAGRAKSVLREAGPDGLQVLSDFYAEDIQAHEERVRKNNGRDADARWERLRGVFDAVGMQRDCHVSRLYWLTDEEEAKAAAQKAGKPILSLRMLGNLNEEYSCANSRFFRTTLYANAEVAQYLRDHFILHWKSVRPVPRITIDMGDGRKIERTITGNSVHYILDAQGRPVDALPGLYGARPFLDGLKRAEVVAQRAASLAESDRTVLLIGYHQARRDEIQRQWQEDWKAAQQEATNAGLKLVQPSAANAANPNAALAGSRSTAKFGVERPLLKPAGGLMPAGAGPQDDDEVLWERMALRHLDYGALDKASMNLVLAKEAVSAAKGREAMTRTMGKAFVETPLLRMLGRLGRSIAVDTLRNEYQMHRQIHEWFLQGMTSATVAELNRKVYAELFLTPDEDPWLGLVPSDGFSALDNGGLREKR